MNVEYLDAGNVDRFLDIEGFENTVVLAILSECRENDVDYRTVRKNKIWPILDNFIKRIGKTRFTRQFASIDRDSFNSKSMASIQGKWNDFLAGIREFKNDYLEYRDG